MKIAYLDTVAGIAGDMTLAAFISAGVRLDELTSALKTLDLGAVELTARHVKRSSIDAVHLDVVVTHEPPLHRTLPAITSLIERSGLPIRVKERAIAVFRVLAEAEAHVHGNFCQLADTLDEFVMTAGFSPPLYFLAGAG